MTPRIPTQLDLIKREMQITETSASRGVDAFLAICEDRVARYKALLKQMRVPEELQAWAGQMKNLHDTEFCVAWHNPLPVSWVVGLFIVLYGEHEHAWPATPGAAEIRRSEQWVDGSRPPKPNQVRPYHVQEM